MQAALFLKRIIPNLISVVGGKNNFRLLDFEYVFTYVYSISDFNCSMNTFTRIF